MKLLKTISALFCLIFIFSDAFGQESISKLDKSEADKVWQMLENSDSRGAFEYLADLLERNGASVNTRGNLGLQLELKEVSEVINYYLELRYKISVSRMPKPHESKIYWENWSKVLAKGNFDHEKFFSNGRERFMMANFNSLVLLAHEYGHYLDDRYKRGQFSGQPLNCGEYFADKFAVAIVKHLASDERFSQIQKRYLELIKTFDKSLPKETQITIADYKTLTNNCASIKMEGNGANPDGSLNYDFFRTYVSAFFNRHQLMQTDKDFPSLSALIETELIKPYFAQIKHSSEKVSVRTIGEYKTEFETEFFDSDLQDLFEKDPNSPKLNQASQTQSAINQKGEIVHLRADWRGAKAVWQNLKLEYLDAEKRIKDSFSVALPKHLRKQSYLFGFAPVSDDELILFFSSSDNSSFCGRAFARAVKQNGAWQVNFSSPDALKSVCYSPTKSNMYVTPSGELKFVVPVINKQKTKTDIRKYHLDREKMIIVDEGTHILFDSAMKFTSQSIFGNDTDRIFGVNTFFYELRDQTPILVGNGLRGYIDGTDKNKIELGLIKAIRWIREKRIVFVDEIDNETHLLREIILN